MRPIQPTIAHRHDKRRLLGTCAIAAGMMALAIGGPAQAQGVAGAGQVTGGSATISPPAPGAPANTTQVTTGTNQTIINWTPSDTAPTGGPIDFLPAGNTLEFYGAGSYTVLNRFVSGAGTPLSRQVALNGTVNSFVGTPGGSGNVQGGNIWFYNAGGILIGSTGVFNVGSLLLTANDIDTSGGLFDLGGNIRFRGAAGSTSTVQIAQGASITASNSDPGSSYVALVAPRIVQNGIVSTDGSTAYVAAEQADIRINNGLFDINVLVGAEGGTVITHTGTTTGPAHQQDDVNDNRIYMVAIPKNDAVSMLVSGQVGYQDAAVAQVDPDGRVVLSAGYNVTGGEIDFTPLNTTAADIRIVDTLFLSDTMAHASGELVAGPLSTIPAPGGPSVPPPQLGRIVVQGNGTFIGDTGAALLVGAGQQVGATGNLSVVANGANGVPGNASLTVNGGQLVVLGDLSVLANGALQADGSSRAGNASFVASDGTTTVGNLIVGANATGGITPGSAGGAANGGTATIMVLGTGVVNADTVTAQANATGGGLFVGQSGLTAADNGGNAAGGTATIAVENGGTLDATTSVTAVANGQGQTGNIQSGTGQGGNARIEISGTGTNFTSPLTSIMAEGIGGTTLIPPTANIPTLNGGDAVGGTAELVLSGDSSTAANTGNTVLSANALGGSTSGDGSVGGDAVGGVVTVTASDGLLYNPDSLTLSAGAESGGGISPSGTQSTTGNAVGGTINLTANSNSFISVDGDIALDARGQATVGENRGNSTGGDIVVRAGNNGFITALGSISADASAGLQTSSDTGSVGFATGGNIDLIADGGTIGADFFSIGAFAETPNTTGAGGDVRGGTIDLLASNNGVIQTNGSFSFSSFLAFATSGYAADGADALGGTIRVIADGGRISLPSFAQFSAGGVSGGDTNFGATGITTGTGGTVLIQLLDNAANLSTINFDNVFADANGSVGAMVEGSPSPQDAGSANGFGGNITVDVQGGNLTASFAEFSADGFGGEIGATGGGGAGQGGTATFVQTGGSVDINSLAITAEGTGGYAFNGSRSGDGFGGTATINFIGGSYNGQNVIVSADGNGGAGLDGDDDFFFPAIAGEGGDGQGGTATINLNGSAVVTVQQLTARSGGIGGNGGDFFGFSGGFGDTGAAGNGTGGTAAVNLVAGTLNTGDLTADATGTGGDGGLLFSSASGPPTGTSVAGQGGDGTGGTATVNFETTIDATGTISSVSRGVGGVGGRNDIGGDGGNSFGGLAQVLATDLDTGSLGVTIDASAAGGNGGAGLNGVGGDGGSATGGTSRVQVDGPNGNVNITQSNFVNGGTGGNGGNAFLAFGNNPAAGPNGGNGGNGTGGTLEVVTNGGTASLGIVDSGSVVELGGVGTGGNGGNGAANNAAQGGVGGNGGNAGNGTGGAIRLLSNGGTIDSGGDPVEITVSGLAGNAGTGGTGTLGAGNNGLAGQTGGGRVTFETTASSGGSGTIDLADTTITASGDVAGRIELLSGGQINLTSLVALVFGNANAAGASADVATDGIFLSANGGTISTTGGMTLDTSGSVGIYAAGAGTTDIGDSLGIFSGGQVEFQHDQRVGTGPTVSTVNALSVNASGNIVGSPDSLVSAGSDLEFISDEGMVTLGSASAGASLTIEALLGPINVTGLASSGEDLDIIAGGTVDIANIDVGDDINITGSSLDIGTIAATGSGTDSEGDGANIILASNGATIVGHAEADNDFTANVGSFATGLNSIITGGDININAPGAVDLGNSTAGGFIQAIGTSINFNTLDAGTTVNLIANASLMDTGAITGVDIIAGGDVNLFGDSLSISNAVQSGGSFFGFALGGPAAINNANADGTISIFANGDLTGTFVAGGDIDLQSGANITASATANGGYVNSNGGIAEGNVFIDAAGNAVVTDGAAARMFGVNAGGSASVSNASAGEDMLVLAGTTINLAGITVGDDLDAIANGAITAQGVDTTGAGTDTRTLDYIPSSPGFTVVLGEGSAFSDGSDITLTSTTASINAVGLSAGDDITLTAATTLAVDGATTLGVGLTDTGSIIKTQSGNANLANLDAFDDIEIDSTGLVSITGTAAAGRDMTVAADAVDMAFLTTPSGALLDTIAVGRNLSITATNAITGGRSQAGGELAFNAGTIVDILSAATTGGGLLSLTGTTGVTADTIVASGETNIFSDTGAIQVNSLSSAGPVFASGDSIIIGGSGSLVFEQLDTDVGDAVVDTSGNLDINSSSVAGRADLSASNNLNIVQLDANNAILSAGNDMTLSTVTATNLLQAQAGRTITITNGVTGRAMSVLSADIILGANGRLGTGGSTDSLDIRNNNSDNQTFIGGTGTRNGYHLDADEMTRIFGSDITVFAPEVLSSGGASVGSTTPPDVVIDDFVLTAGGSTSNLGPNGGLTISTPGKARVIGDASLTGLSDNNSFNLFADDAIEVILGQGTIRMTGTGSTPAGMLNLQSDDVIVATAAAITAVGAATTTDAIDARLAQNDGITSDDGALFAGGISANVTGGFYVQNSGTGTDFALRRGLSFGALGLNVTTASSTTRIVVNGQQIGPNGTVNGLDTIALLSISGSSSTGSTSGSFDPRSTLNGCLIANVASCSGIIDPPSPEFTDSFPVQDIIEKNKESGEDDADGPGTMPVPLIELRDVDPPAGEPLLDDPVTGAGNDDLWSPPAE